MLQREMSLIFVIQYLIFFVLIVIIIIITITKKFGYVQNHWQQLTIEKHE
jgi:hypothetical protein